MDTTASSIRVALVDDHLLVLEALAARIRECPGMVVTSADSDSDQGLRNILAGSPDVVVLDVDLPGRGSFEIADAIKQHLSSTRILFLTGHLTDTFVEQAIRVHAHGYLMKGEPINQLLDAIRKVAVGEHCFSKVVEQRLSFDPKQRRYTLHESSPLSGLTGRQIEVLRHLACGQSVKEVAKSLHLSQKSVDSHKYRIMHKLNIHDRVQLARFAIREGLTNP